MCDIEKRVLTISSTFDPPKGGIAQIVYNYCKFVFNTFYFVPAGKSERSIQSYTLAIIHPFRMVWQFIKHPTIRVVHIHTCSYKPFKHACFTARIAKLFGKKVVMHMHGGGFKDYYNKEKDFVRKQILKIDGIIALSPSWKDFYSDVVGAKNVCVVPNIVPEPKIFEKEKLNGCFNLLYLGHINKAKGIFDLVEMIKENHDEYRGKMMLHIGGGMFEEEKLKQFVLEHQLQDVVTMHGWVIGDDKAKLLSNADAFILPSYVEGQPVSIIEAMSYGLPILSTKVGGIPEMVADGGNGFLFEPGDKKNMKCLINKLIDDKELRVSMSKKSKELSAVYMPTKVRETLFDFYNKLI